MHVGFGLIRGEAHLAKEHIGPARALNNRVAQVGVTRIEQDDAARRIFLRRALDAKTERLHGVQGTERLDRHRTNIVGVAQAKLRECKLPLVGLALRRALDLTHTVERLARPEQGHGPNRARTRPPLAVHLQRDDVAHMIGMAVRQRQGIQLARAHVNPQRAKGARPHVAHERKGTLHPREGIDAARLHQV